jgi:hypothetical protein
MPEGPGNKAAVSLSATFFERELQTRKTHDQDIDAPTRVWVKQLIEGLVLDQCAPSEMI